MRLGGQKPDVYRSLRRPLAVGCENYGRAECGTSGKPRGSPMGPSAFTQRGYEDTRGAYIVGREEEGAMVRRGGSDLQLLHISREAQRLNQMIDSWSKSPSFDGRSTGIAADLLRGALELQESMLMLGNLQEASTYVAEARSEHWYDATEDEEEEEIGAMGVELTGSRRFESRVYQGAQQAKRTPVNGSSANCREELKKVIKTSLYKQSLVSTASDDEKASSARFPKLSSRGEFVDTYGEQVRKTESSGSLSASQKKGKAPNIIARLMGLEEAPSEVPQREVRLKPEGKENSVQPRHFFDIEMPRASKLPSPEVRPEPGRKTLQEIIEAMQFKGLLKAGRMEESRARSPVRQHFRWLPREGEAPPIVIIKPMSSTSTKVGEAQKGPFIEANHVYLPEKGQFSKAIEEAAKKSVLPKEMKNRVKRSVGRDKVEVLYKNEASASSHLKQVKKETNRTIKKLDEMQKPVPDRVGLENRSVRSATVSGSQTKAPLSAPIRKNERRPVQVKNPVSSQTGSSHRADHRSTKPATRKAIDARERKTSKTKPAKELTVASPNPKEENKEIIPAQEKIIPAITSTLPSNLAAKERAPNPNICKRDTGKDVSFHCEVMPRGCHGGGVNSPLVRVPEQDKESSTIVPANKTEELKELLLSSPSFLLHAQELFNILDRPAADCHRTEGKQIATGGSKLLLDCSTELMTSRSHRLELLSHPLSLGSLKHPETDISMNQLLEEISLHLENLRCYSTGGDAVEDCLYGRMERDLKSNNRVFAHGAWDWGWIQVFPVEEADRVACDVERHVLNMLIEEAAVELMSGQRLSSARQLQSLYIRA